MKILRGAIIAVLGTAAAFFVFVAVVLIKEGPGGNEVGIFLHRPLVICSFALATICAALTAVAFYRR